MSNTNKMSAPTDKRLQGSGQDWLAQRALDIRQCHSTAIKSTITAGMILIEVKEQIAHGDWGRWVTEDVGISLRSAQEQMTAARLAIDLWGPGWETADFSVSHRALYLLAGKDVPEEAKEQALITMQQGERLTDSMAKAIIQTALKAKMLPNVSPRVAEMATDHDVDASIIPTLTILEDEAPDVFEEISRSGVVYYGDEAVPLAEANRRDVEDYAQHVRFESRMEKLGVNSEAVTIEQGLIDAIAMSALDAPHILAHTEKPSLVAITFTDKDKLDTVARSLDSADSQPLLVVAAVKGADFAISENGKTPSWLLEILEKVTDA